MTTRSSGCSYLNRVELQNGCLSIGHAHIFIPSTLVGSCYNNENGEIDGDKLRQNMDLAIQAYISRVNQCRGGDACTEELIRVKILKSHLLYCSVIRRPHLSKDIKLLERVQRRASKFLLDDYSSDYKSRLISLKLLPLSMVMELNDILFFLNIFALQLLLLISLTMLFSVHQTLIPPQVTSSITLIVLLHFLLTFILSDCPVFGTVCLFLTKTFLRLQLSLIKDYFWTYFFEHYNSADPCSFHVSCPCTNCLSAFSNRPNFV